MFLNELEQYTWKDEWIHPYESLYSIFQKFKAANIVKDKEIKRILSAGVNWNHTNLMYSDTFFIFRDGSLNLKSNNNYYYENLNIFKNLELLLDRRIRYCPECMKYGFHSIFHQMTFLNKCPIHNYDLIYMCNCLKTYIISSRLNTIAYNCECGASLNVPEIGEAIKQLWKKEITMPQINNDIKSITILDFNKFKDKDLSLASTKLSQKLKNAISELVFTGKTSYESILKLKNHLPNKTDEFFPKVIHDYVINKYGLEECKKNYHIPEIFFSQQITTEMDMNYNFNIISIMFLLKEVLVCERLDMIYPISMDFGIIETTDWSIYKRFVEQSFLKIVSHEVKNYIYKSLLEERFFQIFNYIMSENIIPAGSSIIKMYDTFPVFILVVDQDDYISIYK